jgi:hypothetical protein
VVTVEYIQPRWREGVLLSLLSLAGITVIALAPVRPRTA